jgi:hypothetical protein
MKTSHNKRPLAVALVFAFALCVEPEPSHWPDKGLFTSAEARVGRPATPASVAGVARRTTRRVIRRSTIYVAALPAACSVVVVNGSNLHYCGGVYYQPYGSQYVVVYVD